MVVGFGGAEGGYEEMKEGYLGGWFAVCGLRMDRQMDDGFTTGYAFTWRFFSRYFPLLRYPIVFFRYHEPARMLCAPLFGL